MNFDGICLKKYPIVDFHEHLTKNSKSDDILQRRPDVLKSQERLGRLS